ncbi:CBS domain-containing protein [Pseudidiomarina aestuarii]|uniref:CBS domain-containing protein n=1 Tax=Pseudidiomarina aestuarii TaxID=624146 RepID=A0A7Z6ZT90_9GAMM|nr:CBS domain-containing protein [Pseudidiomarina aestuarii]RUO40979.1 CBS domain-containing protein [Pseudidiomarina aestuarii]
MQSLTVADYMNRHPVVFTASMSIEHAVERLLQSHQRGGPVVDDQQRVVGFLSEQDCLAAMLRDTYHNEQSANVGDCMFKGDVLMVVDHHSITDLAQSMQSNKPKIYPVVDSSGILVGIITRTDVLRAIDVHLQNHYRQR